MVTLVVGISLNQVGRVANELVIIIKHLRFCT